jgi:hypothetical protein
MKISLEPEFSGGQEIHHDSWNFKHFSVVTVPFLCRAIFFILLRRAILSPLKKDLCQTIIIESEYNNEIFRPRKVPKIPRKKNR